MEGTTSLAEALHGALELLFERSHALGPTASNLARRLLDNHS
jgi:hypothetical protein